MDRAVSTLSQKLLEVLEQLLQLSGGDLKATLSRVSDVIACSSGADKVDAFLYDESRDSLVAVGSSTQPLSQLQHALGLDVLPVSNGGRAVGVYHTGETYIGVPLEIGGRRRGMIMLASLQPRFFSDADARFMEAVARWVGIVTHRAELAAEIARNAAEQGRRAGAEELIAVLAHDLRNYLAPLTMRLHVLRVRAGRERREDELRDIELLGRSIHRLGELVNDILDVSRLDQGVFRMEPQEVALSALVREVVAAFEAAQHSIVRRDERPGRDRHALVEVIDEGPGIPADQLPHVFDRFHTGRASQGGLGLGLYVAKRIAAIHGGDLTADSEPGKGARFTLVLPTLDDA